jgi:hypothetical protein
MVDTYYEPVSQRKVMIFKILCAINSIIAVAGLIILAARLLTHGYLVCSGKGSSETAVFVTFLTGYLAIITGTVAHNCNKQYIEQLLTKAKETRM